MEEKLGLIQVTFQHIKNSYAQMKSTADEDAADTGERPVKMEKGGSLSDLSLLERFGTFARCQSII